MKLLLKQVLIADTNAPHTNLIKDVFIEDGFITSISDKIDLEADEIIDINGLIISPGWVDIFAHFTDPGDEYKETLETGGNAATAGGFTKVLIVPNTSPSISSKVQVEYIVQRSKQLAIDILPIGALTKNAEGKELSEMYDMHNSGAIAFSDGLKPVQVPGLLLKALQYVKAFDGIVVQLPIDLSIGSLGLMNEGVTSTQLGLAGIPEISEELIVARDIELARYADSNLHITGVSTAKSIDLIRRAKAEGLKVTVSVTPYHLYFCDEDLKDYDTNLKVNPPIRKKEDRAALQQAVLDGTIDCIASHHLPQDWDNKVCEFEYAKNGMIGLQTTFNVLNNLFPKMTLQRMVELLSTNASGIFKLKQTIIKEGQVADLTLFSRQGTSKLTLSNNKSKSANTPFIDVALDGYVAGVITKHKLYLNQ